MSDGIFSKFLRNKHPQGALDWMAILQLNVDTFSVSIIDAKIQMDLH